MSGGLRFEIIDIISYTPGNLNPWDRIHAQRCIEYDAKGANNVGGWAGNVIHVVYWVTLTAIVRLQARDKIFTKPEWK
ncbi:hypothetical protein GCM10009000_007690 [Halobacterium noricense]|uniref:Uncharacterized protein n=1 Tax=Haladaptatus pallidirubidus TaxID=1008152 RepID=A0AAV3UQ21_9EURY